MAAQRRRWAPCPSCKTGRVVRVLYGMPGPEAADEVERGELLLGGCVMDGSERSHRCTSCGREFDRLPRARGTTKTSSPSHR